MTKNEIADALNEIAVLLELKGENPFKIRAYQAGARVLETLEADELTRRIDAGELQAVKGIGEALADKITTLHRTGQLEFLDKLRASIAPGLVELLEIPGVGPKKIKALHDQLGVASIADLTAACEAGRVAGLAGFGEKTQEKILAGIRNRAAYGRRHLWWDAWQVAQPIVDGLRAMPQVKRAEAAGSLRRGLETVGDLDFIVAATDVGPVVEWFVTQSGVKEVTARGETKASVRFESGLQADLRLVPEAQFVFALHHFTGSKDHNVQLRSRALARGLSLSEWGLAPVAQDGGQRTEDGGQKAEDGGRRTEDGVWRTEGGGRRTEDGEQQNGGTTDFNAEATEDTEDGGRTEPRGADGQRAVGVKRWPAANAEGDSGQVPFGREEAQSGGQRTEGGEPRTEDGGRTDLNAEAAEDTENRGQTEPLGGQTPGRGLRTEEGPRRLKRAGGNLSVVAQSEDDLFVALGLHFIPPELREGLGEIEVAERGALPRLVELSDLRGAFHNHTSASDGRATLAEMAAAADARGWDYLGISDHSKSSVQAHGLTEERLATQIDEIAALNASRRFRVHLFTGTECDILADGRLDFDEGLLRKLDYVVASVHAAFARDEATMTARIIRAIEHPCTTMLGHLTGRLLLRREGYPVDTAKIIDAAIAHGVIIELNANPHRLDLDWRFWRKAADKGLLCSINPDAHDPSHLDFVRAGVNAARKGWLTREQVFNTRPLAEVQAWLGARR